MALNFSRRPLFPACLPEDNLVSHMRAFKGYLVDGIPVKAPMDGSDRSGQYGIQESMHKDILDLLPSDTFGMDITNTFTMIKGWLEDLEVDYAMRGRGTAEDEANCHFLAGFDFIWSNIMSFQAFPGDLCNDLRSKFIGEIDCRRCCQEEVGCSSGIRADELACNDVNLVDVRCRESLDRDMSSQRYGDIFGDGGPSDRSLLNSNTKKKKKSLKEKGEAPHEALTFALDHLGVRDLLSVESVCKSLHFTVRNDPLLWRSLHIYHPLNEKITDDALIQLANRAQRNLQCLSLVECPRITDEGLKHIVENNPRLTKVSVHGCTRLTIDEIVANLRHLKGGSEWGVKQLRIGGLYGVTFDHFEELRILLGAKDHVSGNDHKLHYYQRGNFYVSCEDDRIIDIEVCPICQNPRLVYDCPMDGCEGKAHPTKVCRACTLCIARCVQCGRCIYDGAYEETFSLELLCSECWTLVPHCRGQERSNGSPESPEESGFISSRCG